MTPEQHRARFALGRVEAVRAHEKKEKYKTQLLKLPARLHTSGLGPTVAFYLAAGSGSPEAAICEWIEAHLRDRKVLGADDKLLPAILGHNVPAAQASQIESRYRRAAAETRALAVWLKRFAEAFLNDEDDKKEKASKRETQQTAKETA